MSKQMTKIGDMHDKNKLIGQLETQISNISLFVISSQNKSLRQKVIQKTD
jgi:hypothetical protein